MSFFLWYLIITLLGWLTFPLMFALFPALADRGYTLARAAGLLIWAYIFWLFASLGVAQNDTGGILFALAILIGASAWIIVNRKSQIVNFLQSNLPLIFTAEILFLAAFGFLAFARSANPELYSTEKPMELAFINGILRSPSFPPQDPWLSGYAISYYYFGYVMTAMLARLSNINGSMAHNLMLALTFGLGAVGSFGILYNLLSNTSIANRKSSILNSLLAPLFLLLLSNAEGFLEIIHRRGWFWKADSTSPFWKWLDMKELSAPPILPPQGLWNRLLYWWNTSNVEMTNLHGGNAGFIFAWLAVKLNAVNGWLTEQFAPARYMWWWRASRVIQDYDMIQSPREVIDEFPFFSFLLGDLHPHVLAIPFSLLAAAVALNLFTSRSKDEINLFGARIQISYPNFFFAALVIGGLAFLNTWDILIAGSLVVFAYMFSRAAEEGWNWTRFEDLILLGIPLGLLSIVLYLPFYFGFSSQAGGILPNVMFITRGAHLWVMWGTLFIPIFAYLMYSARGKKSRPNWKLALGLGLGLTFFLWAFSWFLGWVGSYLEADYVTMFLSSQGMTAREFFNAASLRRLENIGSLITLLLILIPTLAFLFPKDSPMDDEPSTINHRPSSNQFILLLVTLAALLVLVPEFIYLRDQFGYRINTVFKFYYQAWLLFSIAAAFGAAYLLENLKGYKEILFRVVLTLVIFSGLLYPAFGLMNKTNNFNPLYGYSLDDFDRIRRENPDEAAAIDFLRTVPNGIIVEAVGDSYSNYARVSANTGLQTVLGWPGHESQWRGSYEPQISRKEDVTMLYTTARWEEAQAIIAKYNIRYIYVGGLEQTSMRVNEEKFRTHLKVIFQQGNVAIYETP